MGSRLGQAGVRDALAKWATPTALRAAGHARVRTRLAKRSPRIAAKVTDEIWTALDRIISQRDQLATEIDGVFVAHPLGMVLALCGFGPRTGARTLTEIGDPQRFADGGRLAAYAGLAPVDRRSGCSINSSSESRSGNLGLKIAMFLAAFVAAQHDPAAKACYQRKRAEGKKHNAAIICLARKRCDIILAMLKTASAYDLSKHTALPEAA